MLCCLGRFAPWWQEGCGWFVEQKTAAGHSHLSTVMVNHLSVPWKQTIISGCENQNKNKQKHTHTHLITCMHTFQKRISTQIGVFRSIFAPFFIRFDPFPSRLVTPTFLGGLFHPSTPMCNDRLEFPAEKLPSLTGVKSGQQGWMSMPWRMTSIRGINGGYQV